MAQARKQGCTAANDRYNRRPMRRSAAAVLSLLCASCAAPEPNPTAFGALPESLVDPPPAPAGEVGATEAELRSELASATDPTDAALLLARLLDREERIGESLAVLDVALRRRPHEPALVVARAGVLRDLGRRGQAIAALEQLRASAGPALHPGLLFELTEMVWLEGDQARARVLLLALETGYAGHEWLVLHQQDVGELRSALETGAPPQAARVRDLLGDLRGSSDSARRCRAFEALVSLGGDAAVRAVAAILDDADPELRRRGVLAAEVPGADLAEFCAMALSDPAAPVRIAGAGRTVELPAGEAAALLLPTLAAETDADAFAALHEALRRVTGGGAVLPAGAATDAAVRAATVAEWRARWER
jgi:hypothetical protein